MTEASGSFKILADFYQSIWRHLPDTSNLRSHLLINITTHVAYYIINGACARNLSDNVQCPPLQIGKKIYTIDQSRNSFSDITIADFCRVLKPQE